MQSGRQIREGISWGELHFEKGEKHRRKGWVGGGGLQPVSHHKAAVLSLSLPSCLSLSLRPFLSPSCLSLAPPSPSLPYPLCLSPLLCLSLPSLLPLSPPYQLVLLAGDIRHKGVMVQGCIHATKAVQAELRGVRLQGRRRPIDNQQNQQAAAAGTTTPARHVVSTSTRPHTVCSCSCCCLCPCLACLLPSSAYLPLYA